MKKAIKVLFILLFLVFTVSCALAAGEKNKPEIKTVDNYIAIFDFEVTTGDKSISRPLADSIIHEFSSHDRYKVIDRGNMNKILSEQKFQISGCVAQECKVEAGQLLGVGKIVSGSVGMVGKTYYLTLQLIDVRTGEIVKSAEDTCKCEIDELLGSTKRLAKKLLSEQIVPPPAIVAKPAPIVESEAEEIARAKAEAGAIAKAKETERIKAEQIAKAKAEEIARAKAEAEEIERAKAEQVAKAEAVAKAKEIERAKTEADELARQKATLEREKQELTQKKQEELERQKALAVEREQLAAEYRKIEAERQQFVISKHQPQPTTGEIVRDGRFIAYSNGTVLDTKTNLMWAANDNGSNISWESAKNYCGSYRGGGYKDWRMPTRNELASLYDVAKTYKSACGDNVHLTELISLTCALVLASETDNFNACNFSFVAGYEYWFSLQNESFRRALPVRSGK